MKQYVASLASVGPYFQSRSYEREVPKLPNTTVEFTDMRAISLGSVLDCSEMASERSGCF